MREPRMRHHRQIARDQWRDQTFAQWFLLHGFIAGLARVYRIRISKKQRGESIKSVVDFAHGDSPLTGDSIFGAIELEISTAIGAAAC